MPKTIQAVAMGYLTTAEAAQRLGLSRKQLHYRIKIGLLPGPDQGNKSASWLFSPQWVERAKRLLGMAA